MARIFKYDLNDFLQEMRDALEQTSTGKPTAMTKLLIQKELEKRKQNGRI